MSKTLYRWSLSLASFRFCETQYLHFATRVFGHSAISPFLGGLCASFALSHCFHFSYFLVLFLTVSHPLSFLPPPPPPNPLPFSVPRCRSSELLAYGSPRLVLPPLCRLLYARDARARAAAERALVAVLAGNRNPVEATQVFLDVSPPFASPPSPPPPLTHTTTCVCAR